MNRPKTIFWSILLLAAVLRFLTLGDRPFDGDEGVILKIAELPIPELLKAVAVDVHPPLYHLLVHAAIAIFGASEWSVRLVGVLAGIGLVALTPFLGSTLRVPGWVLGLLLATSPYLVNLSQDARMYSLLVFLATALWIVTYRLGTDRAQSWLWWIGWTFLALATVYTHHIGWLIVGLTGSVLIWTMRNRISYLVSRISTIVVILILGYLPQLSTTIAQVQGRLAEQSATAGFAETVKGVVGGLYRMLAGRTFLDINPGAIASMISSNPLGFAAFMFTLFVPLFVLVVGLTRRSGNSSEVSARDDDSSEVKEEHSWRQETVVVIMVSLLVALIVGSIGTQASRYLSFLAPLLYGFLAIGVVRIWPLNWGKAAAVVIGLTFVAGLGTQYLRHNQAAGDDVCAKVIEEQSQPGDVVLLRGAFAGGEARAFRFYLDRIRSTSEDSSASGQHLAEAPDSVPVIDLFADYDVRKSNLDELRAIDPAQKAAELLGRDGITRVWYFDNTYQEPTLQNLPEGLVSEIVPLYVTDKESKQLILTKVSKQ